MPSVVTDGRGAPTLPTAFSLARPACRGTAVRPSPTARGVRRLPRAPLLPPAVGPVQRFLFVKRRGCKGTLSETDHTCHEGGAYGRYSTTVFIAVHPAPLPRGGHCTVWTVRAYNREGPPSALCGMQREQLIVTRGESRSRSALAAFVQGCALGMWLLRRADTQIYGDADL